ncbi:hypothetical protein [Clostridium caldaquaticum]|nr:hypothetical protein [Clostridium caldaquaticum]
MVIEAAAVITAVVAIVIIACYKATGIYGDIKNFCIKNNDKNN